MNETLLQTAEPQQAASFIMPASQGQVRFWASDLLDPGNPGLNMPLMWQCNGVLDLAVLHSAFAACVARHESLRTTFELVDGRVQQIIHPHLDVPLPLDDLSHLSGEAQRLEADRITRAHAAFRFDLQRGPLLVLRVLRLEPHHHVLLVTMHHIICDGISLGVLKRDMESFYEGLVNAQQPHLPTLPIQFADYAVWHEEWRHSDEYNAQMDRWRTLLGTDFTPLRLAEEADAAASLPEHMRTATGDIQTLLIPRDLQTRCQAFCAREQVTLNVLLFALFTALMARLSGRDDLAIGSPCGNRTEDTEELIGMFMNIQVLRQRLTAATTFRDVLHNVRDWTLAATETQGLPFEDIVNDPYFQRSGSLEIPVFFLYQKSYMQVRRIESPAGSLQIIPLRSESPGAVFQFMFAVVDRDHEGPRLQLEYNPQKFSQAAVRGVLRQFVQLLDSAVTNPSEPVSTLALTADAATDFLATPPEAATPISEDKPLVHEYTAPRDVLERQLARIWQESLGLERISIRAGFFDLGVSSLAALRLITRMNKVFSLDLGLASLITSSSIESMAELIRSNINARATSSIVPLKPTGTRTPLFVLHGVGGNVINLFGLAQRMAPDQPVYGIQAQSLLPGVPSLLRMEDMAAHYITEMRTVQPHGPYRLLGYSFGGTLAVEMAHQLRAAGEQVDFLGMLDSRTKQFDLDRAAELSTAMHVAGRVGRFTGNTQHMGLTARLAYIGERLHTRLVRYAANFGGRLGLRSLPAWLKNADDINRAAINRYEPRPIAMKLDLFRAELQASPNGPRDLGWGLVFAGGVEIHPVPGDHEMMFFDPTIDTVASTLTRVLNDRH